MTVLFRKQSGVLKSHREIRLARERAALRIITGRPFTIDHHLHQMRKDTRTISEKIIDGFIEG